MTHLEVFTVGCLPLISSPQTHHFSPYFPGRSLRQIVISNLKNRLIQAGILDSVFFRATGSVSKAVMRSHGFRALTRPKHGSRDLQCLFTFISNPPQLRYSSLISVFQNARNSKSASRSLEWLVPRAHIFQTSVCNYSRSTARSYLHIEN